MEHLPGLCFDSDYTRVTGLTRSSLLPRIRRSVIKSSGRR